jgi:hypothetical protein
MNQLRQALESFSLSNDDFVPYVSQLLRRISVRPPNNARNRSISSSSSSSTLSDDSCIEDQLKYEKQPPKGSRTFRTKVYKKRSLKKDLI